MRRSLEGTLMPCAESNKTLPLTAILPRLGVSKPAMQRRVMLLPEPDAPKIPRTSGPISKPTSKAKPERGLKIFKQSPLSGCFVVDFAVKEEAAWENLDSSFWLEFSLGDILCKSVQKLTAVSTLKERLRIIKTQIAACLISPASTAK